MLFSKITEKLICFLKHVCGSAFETKLHDAMAVAKTQKSRHYLTLPLLNLALIQFFNAEMDNSKRQIDIVAFSKSGVNTPLASILEA